MKENNVVDEGLFTFNSKGFASKLVFISVRVRRSIFESFMRETRINENDTVLDIGVSADRSNESINFFEERYPHKNKITAVGLSDVSYLQDIYPGLKFLIADGKKLPFNDDTFEFVFSNAVIEHVGSREEQLKFLKECVRVAKKGVFITTPNRWFPVELHVLWLFIHWLPPKLFRRILLILKKEPLHLEENLNLLSFTALKELCRRLSIKRYSIIRQRLGGCTSNLTLYVLKK